METENSYEPLNESLELNSIEESPLEKTVDGHAVLSIQSDNPVSGYVVAPKPTSNGEEESWQTEFLKMMPAIERQASFAFRGLPEETREDLIEDVIVHALIALKELYDNGKPDRAYPSSLAMYGIRRVKIGRIAGMKLNVRDVSSRYCQYSKGISLERLDRFDRENGEWLEVLVEDRHAGPAETAAARIDFNHWFQSLRPRDRRIVRSLAMGNSTGEVAKQFRVSAGRISQKRQEYLMAWSDFQNEKPIGNCVS